MESQHFFFQGIFMFIFRASLNPVAGLGGKADGN